MRLGGARIIVPDGHEDTKVTTIAHFQKVAWWPGDQGHTRRHTEDASGRSRQGPPCGTLERLFRPLEEHL